jgi:hypothetical protein
MSSLPPPGTPLYNHPLPRLEDWLRQLGARQQPQDLCLWELVQPQWKARILLEVDELQVTWQQGERQSVRHFPYGLTRADVEAAILAGP